MVPEEMEANDTDEVVKVPSGKGLGTDKTGTDSVEQELESGEKGFASDIVEHQSFKSAWKIGINTVFAQKLVMLDVVALECHGVRDTDRDVGNDGKTLVGPDRFQCEVVGDFVNGEKDVLVGCASDNVGGKEHGEGEGMVRLEIKRERQLEAEDGKDKRKGDGSRTHELSDLFDGQGLAMAVCNWLREWHTSGCAFSIAIRLDLWGSSVVIQRKSGCGSTKDSSVAGVCELELVSSDTSSSLSEGSAELRTGEGEEEGREGGAWRERGVAWGGTSGKTTGSIVGGKRSGEVKMR